MQNFLQQLFVQFNRFLSWFNSLPNYVRIIALVVFFALTFRFFLKVAFYLLVAFVIWYVYEKFFRKR
ncbi:hypothetical protein CKF58_08180 [Psittacicella hinzii]|uniref:Uncharacterized protein n=1 Tax=Psittacicella hinzii TaxID=2028575 RepID=A0A3A1YA62_9GAMM|nr:hypothetical protein CKF58_08180 [Psittacicella hinzii]